LNKLIPADNRRKNKVSLCFIDINGLKKVNDTLGHDAGDELILTVVNVIKQVIRETDFIIRMGGDEFIIVFVNISIEEAERVWERILGIFDQINNTKSKPYIVSVSHGIIEYDTIDESGIEGLIKSADKKMYTEKRDLKKKVFIIRDGN
jgi:diguanylate cyclase (GGDEF)-like protein